MENVDPPRPQWIDPVHTLTFIYYYLLAMRLIKIYLGPLLYDSHPTAFPLLIRSLLVYGVAFWISAVSRGRIRVISHWLTAISASVVLATMAYMYMSDT